MTMHITKKFLLLLFIASCTFPHILHGMYIQKGPVALKIEQVQRARRAAALQNTPVEITIPAVIVQKSQYIKNLSETFSEPAGPNTDKKITDKKITDKKITDKKITLKPSDINQETVNFLKDLYDPRATNLNLQSNSLDTLIKAINAEIFLGISERNTDFQPTKMYQSLKTAVLNKTLQEPLTPTSINALQKLNPEAAKEIINDLVQQTKIDARLLENYQKKLEKRPMPFSMPKYILSLSPTYNNILFFNESKIIYCPDHNIANEIRIIDRNNPHEKITFPIDYKSIRHIYCSPNGSLCLLQRPCQFDDEGGYFYTLLDLKTLKTSNIPGLDCKQISAIYFVSNDTLCFISTEGYITLLNLLNNNQTKHFLKIDLKQYDTIVHIACKAENDEITQLIALTSDHRIYVYNKNTKLNTFIPLKQNIDLYMAHINKTGTMAYVISAVDVGYGELFSINLESNVSSYNFVMQLPFFDTQDLTVTDDEKLFIIILEDAPSGKRFPTGTNYNYMISKTQHAWHSAPLDQSCRTLAISENGRESIEQCSGTFSDSYNFATLYDNNMAAALDYLNSDTTDINYTPQQKLLGMFLIHTILNQLSDSISPPISLNATEEKIYQTYLPQEIQTMLAKITNLQLSTNSEQINQIAVTNLKDEDYSSAIPAATTKTDTSSFMNKLSAWYNYYMGKKIVKK